MHWDINISAGTRDNIFLPFRRESGRWEEAENQGSEQAVGTHAASPVRLKQIIPINFRSEMRVFVKQQKAPARESRGPLAVLVLSPGALPGNAIKIFSRDLVRPKVNSGTLKQEHGHRPAKAKSIVTDEQTKLLDPPHDLQRY
jgi:hypothetical protein